MRVTNKFHRGFAIGATVFLIGGMFAQFNLIISLLPGYNLSEKMVLLGNTGMQILIKIILVIVLLRRKKDKVSGILFALLTGHVFLLGVLPQILSVQIDLTMGKEAAGLLVYSVFLLCANILMLVFRGASAAECLKPGIFSGNGKRLLLIVAAVGSGICSNVGTIAVMMESMEPGELGAQIISGLLSLIPQLLVALALAVPVIEKEKNPENWPERLDC